MDRNAREYRIWRDRVLERDNYTCQKCGAVYIEGTRIHAHHIKQFTLYPELATDINNGITLCEKCHLETYKENKRSARQKRPDTPDIRDEGKSVLVALRISELERDELNAFFANRRLKLATGIKMATHYIVDMAKQGALDIGKGGYIDRRKG